MLTAERMIMAPPAEVWDVLVDVEAWPTWGPSVNNARLDKPEAGLQLGTTGAISGPLGVAVPFLITEFDTGRSWAWRVADVPATRHYVDAVDGGTRAMFAVPWWGTAYLPVCFIALRRIEQLVIGSRRGS